METHIGLDVNEFSVRQPIGNSSSDSNHDDFNDSAEPKSCSAEAAGKYAGCYNPIAVVGMACRLPGHSNSPKDLWDFMMRGGIAGNEPPATRFKLDGHFDGSRKPYTMKTPGAMFMEDVDPREFDAQFFSISHSEASSMDPQQRILMEVMYECLENAGVPIEKLSGQRVGCLVGASAVDYHDMDCRDPEDRHDSPTMGSGRALLSNRISHFLNIHGPSAAIDTACSSALTALDMACVYLRSNQVDAMLVGGANMYLSPERNQDMGAMRATASATGRCHAFDSKADGYVAAEAINMVFLKRLQDAVRDGDPIRAIIRGTSVNSAGRTPGMAMPSAQAQAVAIRDAYINSGISMMDLHQTGYVECHGTGTVAGDPIEVEGLASIFAPCMPPNQPLLIGSVKSNVGHSEAAAGLTGLIKVILAIEHGMIPGTPTFVDPNPKIDFQGSRVKAFRNPIKWPTHSKRRASINSFGFGGSNAHAVIESSQYLLAEDLLPKFKNSYVDSHSIDSDFFSTSGDEATLRPTGHYIKPKLVVLSANDEISLEGSIRALSSHVLHPGVDISLGDLAYTLSERRSRLYHRAYSLQFDKHIRPDSFATGKIMAQEARVGFVFTGQGAEWPMMGKDLLTMFPVARDVVEALDQVLARLSNPPKWSLLSMLVENCDASVIREPEFSQPIVTALQLAYLSVLRDWGVHPVAVVGHSSGEIAAAVAAGRLTAEEGIKVAFFRGQAVKMSAPTEKLGMLAVGVSVSALEQYTDIGGNDAVQIACFNSPSSLTLSGTVQALEKIMGNLQKDGHFARMLKVDMAYHSTHMSQTADIYGQMLNNHPVGLNDQGSGIAMFSSVTGEQWDSISDIAYWVDNMRSPVHFRRAVGNMIQGQHGANLLIEIGPSNTLAGPVAQILDAESHLTSSPTYASVAKRGSETIKALYSVAGKLFTAGASIDLYRVNELQSTSPSMIVDLPNYQWNHSRKHWHESLASREWRFRPFVRHDLLGTKILGTPWQTPIWHNRLRIENNGWLRDHKLGNSIVFPGAAYICMAMAAIYQTVCMTAWKGETPNTYVYRLRNIKFLKTLILENSSNPPLVALSLTTYRGLESSWYEFKVSAMSNNTWSDHASGLIRIDTKFEPSTAPEHMFDSFKYPTSPSTWYKKISDYGFDFGPSFRKIIAMDYTMGQRTGRAHISLQPPECEWAQSVYPLHPASMDGCFQSVISSMWQGDSSNINVALVPLEIDSLIVPSRSQNPGKEAFSMATANYVGVGREDVVKNYASSCSVYDPNSGGLVLEMHGMRYAALNNTDSASSSHSYCQLTWDKDITMASKASISRLVKESLMNPTMSTAEQAPLIAQRLINLVAYKNPRLKVLEVNLDPKSSSSLWLEKGSYDNPSRQAFSKYTFMTSDTQSLVEVQEQNSGVRNAEFRLLDTEHALNMAVSNLYLAIVKLPVSPVDDGLSPILDFVRRSLCNAEFVLFLNFGGNEEIQRCEVSPPGLKVLWQSDELTLARKTTAEKSLISRDVLAVHFNSTKAHDMHGTLAKLPCRSVSSSDILDIPTRSKVIVVDELRAPIMSTLDQHQWVLLQGLIAKECDILWVTSGAQLSVAEPTRALVNGFFRAVRNETPFLRIINLDTENPDGDVTMDSIVRCLDLLDETTVDEPQDSEFVERGGTLHISRVFPDTPLNTTRDEELLGNQTRMTCLAEAKSIIRLQAERVGNLDSLQYSEVTDGADPLPPNHVEIEVMASGVNFKDVASVIGLVPENEYLLGGEGSGVIVRTAPDVTSFQAGQRVAFFKKGSFGNRVQASVQVVHAIPDYMSFDEAATIPCVFMTSLYSLFHLANIKRGDKVLIHSATGGVGLAAIQLCRYIGAEIYATVGTQEKRDFLKKTYRMPDNHIFSSRTIAFAEQIMKHTDGKGVNIILNSLSGELLDESWRVIAKGGTMVEIGKRDILDRKMLSMEPFNRNASFRALDLSHEQISDHLVASLLSEVFRLVADGHIHPIRPVQSFGFTDIPNALHCIRGGRHIGKLIISRVHEPDVRVPVRPFRRAVCLKSDMCYLIVGGLRGLCSSIAIWMAKNGARHLTIMSRSGHDEEHSMRVAHNLRALGCCVDLIKGDVTRKDDVKRALKGRPIGGIIQGSMVLRDRPFTNMTLDDYDTALRCKVDGTWNLHSVSLELGLDLDFFTMLSSISGISGSKGQANYAAANTFLDAFASYRRGLGLPASSVDLGVVADVGYMANRDTLKGRYDEDVWHSIDDSLLRAIMGYSIQQQTGPLINPASASQMITGIRVPQPSHSPLSRDARFSALFSSQSGSAAGGPDGIMPSSGGGGGGSVANDFEEIQVLIRFKAGTRKVLEATTRTLNKYLMKILRLAEPLDFARPISAYGIDSLAAVEVRNLLKGELAVDLTTLEIVNAPSLVSMSERIIEQMSKLA